MARKTVQEIPCQEELSDGDLGPYSWTQGPFWVLRAELPCSPSAGILGALLVLVLCPSPAVSQISSWPSTPCQDPPLSVGKKYFFSFRSVFQESGAAVPSLAFPSLGHWSGVILMASKDLLELREPAHAGRDLE